MGYISLGSLRDYSLFHRRYKPITMLKSVGYPTLIHVYIYLIPISVSTTPQTIIIEISYTCIQWMNIGTTLCTNTGYKMWCACVCFCISRHCQASIPSPLFVFLYVCFPCRYMKYWCQIWHHVQIHAAKIVHIIIMFIYHIDHTKRRSIKIPQ